MSSSLGGFWTPKCWETLSSTSVFQGIRSTLCYVHASLIIQGICLHKMKIVSEWVKVVQSCLTLCNPMDCTVHGILQARILEWVAFPSSRGSSQPRNRTQVSHLAGRGYMVVYSSKFTLKAGIFIHVNYVKVSHTVASNSLCSHGMEPARLLCPWNSPGKSSGVGCHSLLQGIFLTQG